ncbi:MAG: hypothetical protein BWK80_62645 [Desulfobacteraceae bacterium IS3]|nr:MAG: hypothetical protein BWK80_62645 [Desulfobacteraceae bacterium IS3]
MKKIAVWAGIVVVMFCAVAQAQTNLVNYQGELTDAEGKVLASGNYKIKFSIFTALTGGTAVWTETHTTVPVVNGHFNVVLGSIVGSIEMAFVGKETYLEISVGDDAPISPRQRILSVPYAINGCPAGVNAFAGPNVPAGWLACNGATVSKLDYPMLFEAIGTAWGNGYDSNDNTFDLPDLRGLFLRGLNSGSRRDPDASGRTALRRNDDGGAISNTGDNVASFQGGATRMPSTAETTFKTTEAGGHTHSFSEGKNSTSVGSYIETSDTASTNTDGTNVTRSIGATDSYGKNPTDGKHTHTISDGGDKETRPINVYVNYIIKY